MVLVIVSFLAYHIYTFSLKNYHFAPLLIVGGSVMVVAMLEKYSFHCTDQ